MPSASAPAPIAPLPPEPGQSRAIAPGVRWIRMGLPFVLDHINLWAIEDGEGWTIVDTGVQHPAVVAAWERLLVEDLGGRPVVRVIATHMHPDHAGLAGWLAERFHCRLWMTRTEYLTARTIAYRRGDEPVQGIEDFFRRAGWKPDEIETYRARRLGIGRLYAGLPDAYRRIRDGEEIAIGGRLWRVIAGGGHTAEHACLYCAELDLLISGDKVLPKISSNISVDATEPDADPVSEWFDTLGRIRAQVPNSALVLPSHKNSFYGPHARIDELIGEQRDALGRLCVALAEPKRVIDLFGLLFNRPIERSDNSLFSLATSETIALLNHLLVTGAITSSIADDGVEYYRAR
ncbi:MAG: MBL fold metallo-hydrolase [Sphingopyxis sp.]|nr:MBL fold metallo-hydrolase [Sphingopyxis sp.]